MTNGEEDTNKQNDRIRVQGKRGSPHSKTGKEKQQQKEQKKKREEEAPKHSKVFGFVPRDLLSLVHFPTILNALR